jgi:hypothetical protein
MLDNLLRFNQSHFMNQSRERIETHFSSTKLTAILTAMPTIYGEYT